MPSTQNYITQDAGDARYQQLGSLGSTTPTTVDAGDTGTAGVATSAARSDHEHPVSITSSQLVPAAWLAGWTSYTPTLTQSGAVTKTVTYAKYIQMGKTVMFTVRLSVTGTGSATTNVVIGLPVTAAFSSNTVIGAGWVYDASANLMYRGMTEVNSTTTVALRASVGTGAAAFLGNDQFTAALASGDEITLSGTYEAA